MKTRSLDEAVFLTIKGFHHTKMRVIADRHSEWTFEDAPKVVFLSKQFWGGSPTVSLNKWLMIRQALKNEQKAMLLLAPKKIIARGSDMRHLAGTEYWFLNKDNHIQHSTYGKAQSHNKRLDANNFYLNRIQAVEAMNLKKI